MRFPHLLLLPLRPWCRREPMLGFASGWFALGLPFARGTVGTRVDAVLCGSAANWVDRLCRSRAGGCCQVVAVRCVPVRPLRLRLAQFREGQFALCVEVAGLENHHGRQLRPARCRGTRRERVE